MLARPKHNYRIIRRSVDLDLKYKFTLIPPIWCKCLSVNKLILLIGPGDIIYRISVGPAKLNYGTRLYSTDLQYGVNF